MPLSGRSPAGSNAMAPLAARSVASPTSTVPGSRGGLQPGGRVDEVARDHALVGGTDGHGGLAREHPGTRRDAGTERPHGVDEVEGGPDRPLGVVLAATGAPQTAMTASPMNFSMMPP